MASLEQSITPARSMHLLRGCLYLASPTRGRICGSFTCSLPLAGTTCSLFRVRMIVVEVA